MKNLIKMSLYAGFMASVAFGTVSCSEDDSTTTNPGSKGTIYTETVSYLGEDSTKKLVQVEVKDLGEGTGTVTWTKDKVYILSGRVFVNEGQTLTIEPGTIIKGQGGQGDNASALIVARGAKIMAEGTKAEPIIFTSVNDNTVRYADDVNTLQSELLSQDLRGLWGGLIVLGKAQLNSAPGETAIEGIPTSESRGLYGGTDDADNSGSLKYISIRHGGTNIGADNEINGLTLGGVGSGTTIENIEVVANADDGVEFFGGTAQIKHLVVAYCGDDAIDYDEGYRGNGQFWLAVLDSDGDHGGEHDGGTTPEDGSPYAHPIISNVTYIGNGSSRTMILRDNAGGEYHNSVFYNFGKGIDVEDLDSGEDSKARYDAGDLKFENNLFFEVEGGTNLISVVDKDKAVQSELDLGSNAVASAMPFTSAESPMASGDAASGAVMPSGSFFTSVDYKGAFGSDNWAADWTYMSQKGLLK